MPFKIISVTGAHSSAGKTTLCTILLKNLTGFGAIKCTRTGLYSSVTDDPEVLLQGDKDTALMSRAGAEKVVWVQSSGPQLEGALDIALGNMNGLQGVVVEGNSPLMYLNPDLIIFVIGERGEIKSSAREIIKKADIIVVNAAGTGKNYSSTAPLHQSDTKIFHIDLIKKQGEIDKFLAYVKKYTEE